MSEKFRVHHKGEKETRELFPGGHVVFTHSDNMTFADWHFEAGAELPQHSHPHEQITRIISGIFEMTVDGTPCILKEGSMVVIPPRIVHSGKAITECALVDAFYPVREDYL